MTREQIEEVTRELFGWAPGAKGAAAFADAILALFAPEREGREARVREAGNPAVIQGSDQGNPEVDTLEIASMLKVAHDRAGVDESPWVCAAEVCRVLIAQASDALLSRLAVAEMERNIAGIYANERDALRAELEAERAKGRTLFRLLGDLESLYRGHISRAYHNAILKDVSNALAPTTEARDAR